MQTRFFPLFMILPLVMAAAVSCSKGIPKTLVPADYSGWGTTTTTELNYPIPGHENNYRKIFINDTGFTVDVRDSGGKILYDYPDGTVIIKEIYQGMSITPGSKPMVLTVMIKDRENPKARGGWLWIVKNLASGDENIISQEFCITCHTNANEPHPYGDGNKDSIFRDYAFFPVK